MNKKRLIIYQEPDDKYLYNCNFIKEITGSKKINARLLFSNETDTVLHGTHIVECNKRCQFDTVKGLERRLIEIIFRSSFKDDPEKFKNCENIFKKNSYYVETEFQEKYKSDFFYLLMEHYKTYQDSNYEFTISPYIQANIDDYIKESDVFLSWFESFFEFTDDKSDYVFMNDVYNLYTESLLFKNLSRTERRGLSKNTFFNNLCDQVGIKEYCSRTKRIDKLINGKRITKPYIHSCKKIICQASFSSDSED